MNYQLTSPFYSIRGGTIGTPHPGMYPDAITNTLHGYAELDKHTDEEIDHIHEVKATVKKPSPHWADEDYEDEDLFFHALVHNNDEPKVQVVETASNKRTKEVDEWLEGYAIFGRL